MIKVRTWTLYDLGNAYGFAMEKNITLNAMGNTNFSPTQVDIPRSTYLRLVFTFDINDEHVQLMKDNKIDWKNLNPLVGYFTTDFTFFPFDSIAKLKECISEEMLALCNLKSDISSMNEYLAWFIRNVYTTDAVFIDVPLDRELLNFENEAKNNAPIAEIYSKIPRENPMHDTLVKMYPAACAFVDRNKNDFSF